MIIKTSRIFFISVVLMALAVPTLAEVKLEVAEDAPDSVVQVFYEAMAAKEAAEYFYRLQKSTHCVTIQAGNVAWGLGAEGVVCVLDDIVENRQILYVNVDGGLGPRSVLILRNGDLLRNRKGSLSTIEEVIFNLVPGRYEVLLVDGDDTVDDTGYVSFTIDD